MRKVVILGAGLAGMSAGEKLAEKFDVTILEVADHVGGLAASFKINNEWIPKFYHHIIASNKYTIESLKRFGALEGSKWQKIKVAIGAQGGMYKIQNPIGLLKIPGASLIAKFRFGLFGLYTLFLMNPDKIPDEMNAKEWLYKYCGKEATDYFWWNLYGRNKFNIPLDQIAAKQFAHRLWEKEVYDNFTFPPLGLHPMIQGFKNSCLDKGCDIKLKTNMQEIDLEKKTIKLKGEEIKYDILVNTIPVPELIKITKGIPKDYEENIKKLRYCPAVGVCFSTKDWLLPGVYWINLFGERVHVVMQHSVLCDKYDHKVTWLIRYGGSEEDIDKSDEEIKELYFGALRKYFPNMEIKWEKVFKAKYAEPVYDKDYVKYAPTYETPVKDLFMAGIQVTFPKIRNQNVAIESGYKVADLIISKYS
jgi:protoporphyrinogen oxidase